MDAVGAIVNGMKGLDDTARKAQMREVSEDFEAVFLTQLFALMEPEESEDNLFGGGFSEQMFKDELHAEMGKQVAKSGGVGIADSIYAQMLKYQEV